MHVQWESSQVRSALITCAGSAGSTTSSHSRGKSSPTSASRGRGIGSSTKCVTQAAYDLDEHWVTRCWSTRSRAYRSSMRLGVLDVGSNTVHLLVVDARRGGHPTPA